MAARADNYVKTRNADVRGYDGQRGPPCGSGRLPQLLSDGPKRAFLIEERSHSCHV